MGEAKTSLRSNKVAGVLSHLENLEDCAHKAGLKQGEIREHQENVARLKERIQELKHLRDELKTKLDVCRTLPEECKDTTKHGPQTFPDTEIRSQVLSEWKIANLKGLLQVFHLTDHLNAFAGRKFQADQLLERFGAFLEGPLQGNSLYNTLEFSYSMEGKKTFPFTAKLTYGDLVCTLPTEVTVTCKDDALASEAEMAAVHLALFREKPLHKAFSSIADTAGNLSPDASLESSVATPGVSSG